MHKVEDDLPRIYSNYILIYINTYIYGGPFRKKIVSVTRGTYGIYTYIIYYSDAYKRVKRKPRCSIESTKQLPVS